jgi:carbamoyl-phosphate synthase large subunit
VLPPITLGREDIERIRESTRAIAEGVGVRGLINIQFALSGDVLYVLEANPRASRTVPFVSKATSTPLAKACARLMLGESIADLRKAGVLPAEGDGGVISDTAPVAVKEAVMPFNRFRTYEGTYVDTVLGPEMRSTGEVMGIDSGFGTAFAKSQAAASNGLPTSGTVFVSVANRDKRHMIFPVKRLADLGFEILATSGTAAVLKRNGVNVTVLRKLWEDDDATRSTVVDKIKQQGVQLIINTPHGVTSGAHARLDGYEIRTAAVAEGIPCITTIPGLAAAVQGIEAEIAGQIGVKSLQDWTAASRLVREGA